MPSPDQTVIGSSPGPRPGRNANDVEFARASARRAEAEARLAETLVERELRSAAETAWRARQERKRYERERLGSLYAERKRGNREQ